MSQNISQTGTLRPQPRQALFDRIEFRVIAFILVHAPLAFILDFSGWLGAIHAGIVSLYGLRAASRQQYDEVIAVIAYIAGAEILWRMTDANIPWEFGKYATIGLTIFAILTSQRNSLNKTSNYSLKLNPALFFYFAFLLPAVILTFANLDVSEARQQVSFNLSGPLAISVLGMFLWRYEGKQKCLTYLLIAVVAPVMGIFALSAFSTLTTDLLDFSQNANFAASGGYGPNQVSNILGLGSLASLILLVFLWQRLPLRIFFAAAGAVFLAQAVLTFSRGGVFSFLIMAVIFSIHLFRSAHGRNRFLILIVIVSVFVWLVGIPFLDSVTSSVWQDRFTDLDTTGRRELAEADWQTFLDNPLAGVGVGMAKELRILSINARAASHTEFTRTLAEHGLLGVISFLILLAALISRYRQADTIIQKALIAGFASWSFSVMVHSGMRFVAISFLIALAMISWDVSLEEDIWEGL